MSDGLAAPERLGWLIWVAMDGRVVGRNCGRGWLRRAEDGWNGEERRKQRLGRRRGWTRPQFHGWSDCSGGGTSLRAESVGEAYRALRGPGRGLQGGMRDRPVELWPWWLVTSFRAKR